PPRHRAEPGPAPLRRDGPQVRGRAAHDHQRRAGLLEDRGGPPAAPAPAVLHHFPGRWGRRAAFRRLPAKRPRTRPPRPAAPLPPARPPHLRGGPGRIRQTLINLAGNAVKFTSQGRVLLNLECEESTGGEALLRLAVSDTGIGIAPERVEHIFDKFTQVDA